MNLVNMAVSMQQGSIQDKVSTAVLKLTVDSSKEISQNTIDMMSNSAIDPNRGRNIDALA